MKYSKLLLGAIALGFSSFAPAQIVINVSGNYSQTFDSLPLSGTANTWTDNSTLAGWYADREIGGEISVLSAGTGSSTTTALYSFGSTSATDRSLGALSSGSSNAFAYGVVFQNASAQTMTFTDFSYRGELWRMGSPAQFETLEFAYRISSTPITSGLTGTWIDANDLDFTSASSSAPSGATGAVDGNLVGNFTVLNATLSLVLDPGSYLMFRWYDIDHESADNGLGIDNVSISYVSASTPPPFITAVPEPSTYGILGAVGLIGAALWRRRRPISDL
ncbi:MAG: PEP-CTERM sorting domain-containing protein [Opitutaceae bacterium]